MEDAIKTLVKVYLKSSKGKESLGKKDFQNLVKSQLGNILTGSDSKEAINNMAAGLDGNQDGKVDFPEYMKLIGYLATSLSEQRSMAKDEPAQNATGQVANSSPEQEQKGEVNAEANAEPKAEGKEGAAATVAVGKGSAALKVEVPKVEIPKVEAEGETPQKITTTVTSVGLSGVVTEVTTVTKEFTEVTEGKEVVKEVTIKAEEAPAAEEKTEEETEEKEKTEEKTVETTS